MNVKGQDIRTRRKAMGLSKKELADISHVAERTIKNIECSKERSVSISVVNQLANSLGCSFFDIVTDDKNVYSLSYFDRVNALSDSELKFAEKFLSK